MRDYYDLLEKVLKEDKQRGDRTGTGTIGSFGHQMRFDLKGGFPLLTGKRTPFKLVAAELLWFLEGSTSDSRLHTLSELLDDVDTIWNEWAVYDGCSEGELGPIYGKQWRSWWDGEFEHDQIQDVISSLKSNPLSRRHIVSAWNLHDLPDESKSPQDNVRDGFMALPPCHVLFQFYARELTFDERYSIGVNSGKDVPMSAHRYQLDDLGVPKYELSCQLYQRSADLFLGVPFNIASYSLLTHMIAQVTNMTVGDFIHTIGDAHIYSNHVNQVQELLGRVDRNEIPPLPSLELNSKIDHIDKFTLNDFNVIGYEPLPAIKAPIAV